MKKEKQNKPKSELGIGKYSWKQVIKFLLVILVIYALGSILISNPFSLFDTRTSPLSYSKAMYFHGLSVGLAGLLALFISQELDLKGIYKKIIFYFTVSTIFFGVTGGAINRSMEYKFTLWYQVLSFFSLDVVLITLLLGIIFTKNISIRGTKTYVLTVMSAGAIVVSALIGDLAGFILDFGNWPGICGWYANQIGYTLPEWQDALLRSHSDMIVVSVLCLLLAIISYEFGKNLIGTSKKIFSVGQTTVIVGIVLMLLIYLISGFGGSGVQIPHIFTEKGFFEPRGQSTSGIDIGDFTIGIFVMLGGLLILAAIAFGKREVDKQLSRSQKYTVHGIFIIWTSIVLTVVIMGFLEEYKAYLYNSSVTTSPMGDFGFAFRMLHVDVSLILFPAIMLLMLFAQRFLFEKNNRILNWILNAGVIVCLIGSLVYMIVTPAKFGPGYFIVALGFSLVVIGVIYFVVSEIRHKRSSK